VADMVMLCVRCGLWPIWYRALLGIVKAILYTGWPGRVFAKPTLSMRPRMTKCARLGTACCYHSCCQYALCAVKLVYIMISSSCFMHAVILTSARDGCDVKCR